MIFRKKKKEKEKVLVKSIPLPILMRQAIYDTMLEPAEGIAEILGLPPISDEVSEMEEQASQDRLTKFSALFPFIDSHSDITARIAAAAYLLEGTEDGDVPIDLGIDEDEAMARLTSLFKLVGLSSSISWYLSFIYSRPNQL
jgi:hypothetical protein